MRPFSLRGLGLIGCALFWVPIIGAFYAHYHA